MGQSNSLWLNISIVLITLTGFQKKNTNLVDWSHTSLSVSLKLLGTRWEPATIQFQLTYGTRNSMEFNLTRPHKWEVRTITTHHCTIIAPQRRDIHETTRILLPITLPSRLPCNKHKIPCLLVMWKLEWQHKINGQLVEYLLCRLIAPSQKDACPLQLVGLIDNPYKFY